ncbi:hypothetical protein GLOIN_2v1826132 [Rhizophagus irregularis DAOM 181602=DAOM 197198]|nr:hypothetical protein GLOIN_2v1826132 [Rhizophagus irregularis DAOM 181602=DAOM 197198]
MSLSLKQSKLQLASSKIEVENLTADLDLKKDTKKYSIAKYSAITIQKVNSEEKEEKDLNYADLDYDLNYAKNTENYQISKVFKHAKNHEEKSSIVGKKHIYVLVELSHRAGKRSKLFQFNEYGDLMIIMCFWTSH